MGPHIATFTSMVFLYDKYRHAFDEGGLFLDTGNPDLMFPHRVFSRTFVSGSMPEVIPKVDRPIQKINEDNDDRDDDPWYQDPNHAIAICPPPAEPTDTSQNPPSDIEMRDEENPEVDGQERLNLSMHSINDEGAIDFDDAVEFACHDDSPQRKECSSSEEESEDESMITANEASTSTSTFFSAEGSMRQASNESALSRLNIEDRSPYFSKGSKANRSADRSRSPLKRSGRKVPTPFKPPFKSTPKQKPASKPPPPQQQPPFNPVAGTSGINQSASFNPTPGPSGLNQSSTLHLFLEDSSVITSPERPSALFTVTIERDKSRIARTTTIFKLTNKNPKSLCWFNAPFTVCQNAIYLWNVQNQASLLIQKDGYEITGNDFEELLLKMGKCQGKYKLNPRDDDLIGIFARQYHPNNVYDILNNYQSPEQAFFTELLAQGEERSSVLSNLMQSIVKETTTREATCGCTEDTEVLPEANPELKPIWLLEFPEMVENRRQSFTEMFAYFLEDETQEFPCNNLLGTRDFLDDSGNPKLNEDGSRKQTEVRCQVNVKRTKARQILKASDILILQVNRDAWTGDARLQTFRRSRNHLKIDLKENDTLQVPLTNGDTVEYSLVGTIQSIGSVDSGHFVSHVKVSTGKFIVVDDDSALKYSTISRGDFNPEVSYIFIYLKRNTPSFLPHTQLPTVQPMIVDDQSQEVPLQSLSEVPIRTSFFEKQVVQGRDERRDQQVILRNQVVNSPVYQGLDYFFLDNLKYQWIGVPLMALISTLKQVGVKLKRPPREKARAKWSFLEFARCIFHCKPGDVIATYSMLEKAQDFEDRFGNIDLLYSPQKLTQIFELKVLQDEEELWSTLKPTFLTKNQVLYCPSCQKTFHDALTNDCENCECLFTLELPRKMPKNNSEVSVQELWNNKTNREDRSNLPCETCKRTELLRLVKIQLLDPKRGLILQLDKSRQLGVPKSQKAKVVVQDELLVQNSDTDVLGEFTTYKLLCAIEEVNQKDSELDMDENVITAITGTDYFKQYTFHFFHNQQLFKVFNSDKIGTSSRDELNRSTLLFYKVNKETTPSSTPENTSESSDDNLW